MNRENSTFRSPYFQGGLPTHLGKNAPKAIHLTDKEKLTLSVNGKLSKETLAKAEIEDMPPAYRLACQYLIQDEDILVEFTGEPGVEIDLRK